MASLRVAFLALGFNAVDSGLDWWWIVLAYGIPAGLVTGLLRKWADR